MTDRVTIAGGQLKSVCRRCARLRSASDCTAHVMTSLVKNPTQLITVCPLLSFPFDLLVFLPYIYRSTRNMPIDDNTRCIGLGLLQFASRPIHVS